MAALPRLRSLLLAVAAWALLFAGAASAHASVPCRPGPGTTTIAHSKHARIFSDERNGNDYACLYSNGHPRYLSTTEHFEYPLVRFAGPYVAYMPTIEAVPGNVSVLNMSTGRAHEYESAQPIEGATCAEVTSLALKGDGAVAWIATNFLSPNCEPRPGATIEVRAHDRHGLRVLDTGTVIGLKSLRLSRSTVTWKDGGATRSATLD